MDENDLQVVIKNEKKSIMEIKDAIKNKGNDILNAPAVIVKIL